MDCVWVTEVAVYHCELLAFRIEPCANYLLEVSNMQRNSFNGIKLQFLVRRQR